jgi:hypothetical protein
MLWLNPDKLKLRLGIWTLGLLQELISLLQGRVERTVFTQFYLKENPKKLADETMSLVGSLEQTLLATKMEITVTN